ncbi:HolB ATPase involved in DNA replication [uncultured Caudovirales phage]|jgi:DNA polymerase III delta prime subunit|uniref:Sliding-clamp-loader large subunit n=1 Tax=uncultured Caudovirales phage TaxID=2100421 RepID=A0A6J5M089_9CAUD|nr:HolB ATPase involved in DNA replication [uncultured Caudovirales phage]
MKQHTILNEKYRPDTLEGYICSDGNKDKFQEFINNQDIPHILLAGRPGSGKTTLAKILANNINCDYLFLNAVDERSIDVMRDKVGSFASAGSFKPLKIVILDEATHILQASQVMLLNMMETYSINTRFILTGNYPERLIEPLRSRCQEFDLEPPSKKVIAKHVDNILNIEDIKHTPEDVVSIIKKFYPDFRRIINACQKYTVNNEIKLDSSITVSDDYKNQILETLKNPKPNSFNTVRQILADADLSDYTDLYRFLYDNIDEYTKNNVGEIIILIEEYRYHSVVRIDQEICFCALISKIISILLFKTIKIN